MRLKYISLLLIITIFGGCKEKSSNSDNQKETADMGFSIEVTAFGQTPDGPANLYTLKNKNGMTVKITNYGGIVTSISVPDKQGQFDDVVLGFDSLQLYLDGHPYFGAIVGRYGNRIGKGRFSLDGTTYALAVNNGENHLHGGIKGFDKHLWKAEPLEEDTRVGLKITRVSKDMEEGYPGNLSIEVSYWLDNQNALTIDYLASTDKKTICNLTNHSYFNLAGAGNGDILNHEMHILADQITPVDEGLIPTGEFMPVEGTPFDFTNPTSIGAGVNNEHPQIKFGGGYDHNYVLRESGGLRLAATVYERNSGRFMEVRTTEPGVQFYCGNFLDGTLVGKGGKTYNRRYGLCLETQHYPDAPNQDAFPSVVLEPGQKYKTTTSYSFSVK
jgi:aldose 1-epimerase